MSASTMTHSFQDDRKQTCGAGLSIRRSGISYPLTDSHALLNAAVLALRRWIRRCTSDLSSTETWRVLQAQMGINQIPSQVALIKLATSLRSICRQ